MHVQYASINHKINNKIKKKHHFKHVKDYS